MEIQCIISNQKGKSKKPKYLEYLLTNILNFLSVNEHETTGSSLQKALNKESALKIILDINRLVSM